MDVEELVRPVVEAGGLVLWDVEFHTEDGRRVLRVMVDREGGVDLDTIAATSERLSRRLDLEDPIAGRYSLEVSSPGLERTLRQPSQFARSTGERVKVKTDVAIDGEHVHTGTLLRADERGVVVATNAGERPLAFADIVSARTVFEWGGKRK